MSGEILSSEYAALSSEVSALQQAAQDLAGALRRYSEAAYQESTGGPDPELEAAKMKVESAKRLIRESRLGYALGTCLPDHVRAWPAWIKRGDFAQYVGFQAHDIEASSRDDQEQGRKAKIIEVRFTFAESRYCVTVRDEGWSSFPSGSYKSGEVELTCGEKKVAVLGLTDDGNIDYSRWKFVSVRALKVGPWMKDIVEIAAQIDAFKERRLKSLANTQILQAARDIDFG